MSMDANDQDRIAALERVVAAQMQMIDQLAGFADSTLSRVLALQQLVSERAGIAASEIAARAQSIDLDSTAEIELDPRHEEFRRLREILRGLQAEDLGGPGGNTGGSRMAGPFEEVWARIVAHEGEPFHQKTGACFTTRSRATPSCSTE